MPWKQLPEAPKAVLDALRGKARILVDGKLGEGVASFLRDQGCNVEFAGDVGLAGKDDTEIASYAWREKRMIWTHDRDFLDDTLLPEHRNPGVVVLPGGDGSLESNGRRIADRIDGIWSWRPDVVKDQGDSKP